MTELSTEPHDLMIPLDPVASAVHTVMHAYATSLGEDYPATYLDLTPNLRESARQAVLGVISGNTPQQQHEQWCIFRLESGWVWGPVKDGEAKTHPCLVPYAQLPPAQRAKDALFIAATRAVIAGYREGVMHGSRKH